MPFNMDNLEGALQNQKESLSVNMVEYVKRFTDVIKDIALKIGLQKIVDPRSLVFSKLEGEGRTSRKLQLSTSARAMQVELIEEFRASRADSENLNLRTTREVGQEIHDRRDILLQFLDQHDAIVNLEGMGKQSSKSAILRLPESRLTDENRHLPPIFLVPGIRNDLECVMGLAQEYAYSGRTVVVSAMPESYRGKVTKEFTDAVESDPGYGPHIAFFKGAIDTLKKEYFGDDAEIELMGWSTGCDIIEGILADQKYRDKTTKATMFCRASSENIRNNEMTKAVLNELKTVLTKNFPNYVFSKEGDERGSNEQSKLKKRIFNAILKRVTTKTETWEDTRVKDKGKIVVWSGKRDGLTMSSQVFSRQRERELRQVNPQIVVVEDENGFHNTPVLETKKVMGQISAKLAEEKGI